MTLKFMKKIILIATIFLFFNSVAKAADTEIYEISGIEKWFNSKPIKISNLRGKVVLVDFWAYSCVNCLRSLPNLIELDKKYRAKNLVLIGVHSPEFDFEKNSANVKKALKKYGIKYPVAMDNNLQTWRNFNNHFWPAQYLLDKEGKLVYYHFGEGDHEVLENKIRTLLNIDDEIVVKNNDRQFSLAPLTPEIYLGSERSEGNLNWPKTILTFPESVTQHGWALQGKWKIENQFIESKNINDSIKLSFVAKKVFLVMSSASGKSVKVKIFLDDKEIDPSDYGTDVINGSVIVKDSRLYSLVNLSQKKSGVIELQVGDKGLRAYAFTFGM